MNDPVSSADSTALVSMHGITKRYPGCVANDSVDLTLHAGSIQALLGENGAGKSTLVKVLYGLLQADEGHIEWQGQRVHIDSPATARQLGIALVFQHFSLFESMSVLENIALGMAVDANAALAEKIVAVSARYGLPLDPHRSVFTLSVGERQRIEIVRCLLQSPKLLIMDEPTSVLTPQEVSELFVTLRQLAQEGVAILYISHKLDEIKALCHEATVLRGGKRVATAVPSEESAASLAALMMGSELHIVPKEHHAIQEQVLLSLDKVSFSTKDQNAIPLRDLSLSVHAGEVLGIAGVAGNGQDELMRIIAGEEANLDSGTIMLNGEAVGSMGAGARRVRGLCCVPEERLGHAAVPDMSLSDNAFLTAHHRKPLRWMGMRRSGKAKRFAKDIIDAFNVRCSGERSLAGSLSGGNLQKFIVGREILQSPTVLVVAQPTWGVDAGAAAAIHEALLNKAKEGVAVLLISQDLDELMRVTDRIAALCAGQLSAVHRTADVNVQQVGLLMGGQSIEQVSA